jgi:hypothetical protein
MPGLAPNIDNYTVPGGIKLFFNDGSGERDLGNIAELNMEPNTDELEHKTNRGGKRRTDKVLTIEDKLTFKFKLDEPVIENLKYFFRGGNIESQGAGAGSRTDDKLTLDDTAFVSVGPYYGLSAVIVRQFLDYVFLYDGADYVDNSAEADTLDGTPFDGLKDSNDKLYLGKLTRFKEAYFDFAVNGSYGSRTWEYWNGSAWSALVVSGTAEPMNADGKISFTPPSDWAQTMVNGATAYFIRVSVASVTTPATVNEIRQNGVLNTDYTLDAGSAAASRRQDGRLARISGGMFADGEEVKVSFSYATWTSFKMGLFTGAIVEGSARLEMHPLSGMGIQHDYIFPKAVIKPGGSVPFDDTKWMEVPFELQVLDDSENNPDYPMGYILSNETS